ncbi:inactive beta-amylase 9-like [Phragmites australis]|uniref:inactive beta-amylase 9-like n=1 Tax=Phragmites australis TaxID=29695 RepID=UPI002D793DF7|nr:inactive beta-amylase 9-like [Phragmites australis]
MKNQQHQPHHTHPSRRKRKSESEANNASQSADVGSNDPMEAVLMLRAAAAAAASPARWRCFGEASLAGQGQPGVVRLGFARRSSGAVRARLGPARAHLSVEPRKDVTGADQVDDEEEDAGAVTLFVGLPADVVVSDGRAVNRPKAVSAALRALKLLGVDGVEMPVSWAIVQPGSGDLFEWAGYVAVAGMVRDAGLSLRVSLNTDGAALPRWVAAPDALFTDRSGHRREGCLSFAVDELPVLAGKSPLEAYEAFFRSFADVFEDFFGSTITDVTVSLGPNGELRYPSYPPGRCGSGVGEFQCYDKYMLARLKRHAESSGQPLWGLTGPHDGPRYDESPESSAFFREPGGSWKTEYGGFFLSWYTGELLGHGDRVLAAASRAFGGKPVELSAKVPLLHRSRPTEATAGLHGGYGPVAEMFARHACTVIASGVEDAAGSSPADELLVRIKDACSQHGARLAAESVPFAVAKDGARSTGAWAALLTAERTRPCQFTYQRMGAEFFSPAHWPQFVQFVRALECPEEVHEDDLPGAIDGGELLTVPSASEQGDAREVQTV